jgi:hypothetical protein
MLMLLPIVVALAATDPAPAASTAPRPTPLTEIGRVRALPACVPIVAHANGAITHALDNDRTLAVMSLNLHNTDFDRLNVLQRNNAIEGLMKHAESMRAASSAGNVEIKKLREYAVNSPDPNRKAELKAFADALGGAIDRQKRAAAGFMGAVTTIRGREEATSVRGIVRGDSSINMDVGSGRHMPTALAGPLSEPPPSYNRMLQSLGDALDELTQTIAADEGHAADHSIAATSGC